MNMSARVLLPEFFEHLQINNYARSSIYHYAYVLKKFMDYYTVYCRKTRLEEITREDVQGFFDYLKQVKNQKRPAQKLSENTRMHIISCLKTMLDFCTDEEIISQDFNYLFEMIQQKERIPKNILSEKEIQSVLSLPNERTFIGFRDKVIFELMYNTGLRKTEVINLEMYDINFEEHSLFIRLGKGRKDRIVPIGVYLEQYLKEYIMKVRPALLLANALETKLFITIFGNAMKGRGLASVVERYRKKTELHFSCHTFRHCFSTHMLKHGANILYIQRILGHENVSTTEIYTKIYPVDLKRIIEKYHPRSSIVEKANLPGKQKSLEKAEDVKLKLAYPYLRKMHEDDELLIKLGHLFRSEREKQKFTLAALAKKTGTLDTTLLRIEHGKRMRFYLYVKVYEFFNLTQAVAEILNLK